MESRRPGRPLAYALMAAVMAPQDPVPVVRQAHITVGALHGLPTGTAGNEACIAPAVHEQHDLFLPAEARSSISSLSFRLEHGPVSLCQLS